MTDGIRPIAAARPRDREAGPTAMPDEIAAAAWILRTAADGHRLPPNEAKAIVDSIYAEQRWGDRPVLPLLVSPDPQNLRATHAVNVTSLAMRLAASLQFEPHSVRSVGLAALLHDVGMARLPAEILEKQGQLTADERDLVMQHPVEGARILLQSDAAFDLAAVVAYEHHLRMDSGGYPVLAYPRAAHFVSRLVQVCDVFASLASARPYRAAWPIEISLSFLRERAGFEFHPTPTAALVSVLEEHIATNVAA